LSRLSILSVNGRFEPIIFMNFGMISNGKNKLLKKNIGSAITKELNNAVFSEFDIAPSINPIKIKFALDISNIIKIGLFIGMAIPNSLIVINITINSIIDIIRKNINLLNKNIGIDVGLNKVLASVPDFLSYTIFEDDTNIIVNNRSTNINP